MTYKYDKLCKQINKKYNTEPVQQEVFLNE